jgi:hypothetical protein
VPPAAAGTAAAPGAKMARHMIPTVAITIARSRDDERTR